MRKDFKRIGSFLLVFALIIGLMVPFNVVHAAEQVTITVLATSDIHGALYNWNYEDSREDNRGGMVKLATIIKEVRKENPNTILVDNGDTIQGSLLTDDLYNTILIDEPHPIIEAMNLMGYDSMTLGNHEFNFGLDLIQKIEKEADFPMLSANIFNKEDGSYFVTPYTIKEVAGIKVGIIGLTTPNIPRWDGPRVTSLDFRAMHKEAEKVYQKLMEDEGVDIVIATAHSGLEGRHDNEGSMAKLVAERIPQLAAFIVGHDHDTKDLKVNGVPVVGPTNAAREIARVDITLEKQGDQWIVVAQETEIISAEAYEVDAELAEALRPAQETTLEFISKPATVATASFVPEYEIKDMSMPSAQLMDSAVIDLINNVQLHFVPDADIAAAALFASESNIKEGPVAYGDIFGIYKYPNTLYGVEVTGAELKNYMEWSASYYNTYKPGDITISFNPDIRGYNYDMFQGVDYKVDISQEPGDRIVDLTFNGESVMDDDTFNLAINNYRYNGLLDSGIISNDAYFISDPKSLRSYIFDYISEMETIDPEVDNNWEIIGADLSHRARQDAVNLINKGIIDVPAHERSWNSHSINLEEQVTRGEFVEALVRTLEIDLPEIEELENYRFTDVDEALAPYVEAAYNLQITSGISQSLFGTSEKINREQAFVFLIRALNLAHEYNVEALNEFSDYGVISDWAYEELAAAVELGFTSGNPDGTLAPREIIKRGEMAQILNIYLNN
ncbi:5'-Nucleotidase domain protein [Alkaliphilus metalliredigens QYMF]|uniref:5'-Nucleotidase domain protein n=1 Tax=Alkaliphilus metalliredigens (strain QYMF) TaxID=293826 RepID=A6TU63_ALKMQ|nr:5'-nucleotidase C-terminal domain-containing protein [Alkaliphilus metalliredigens]ABR49731.1 5'-Nucleotidase domain protein [Alkaliphilus metalliredigens QYMF]